MMAEAGAEVLILVRFMMTRCLEYEVSLGYKRWGDLYFCKNK